MEDQPNEDPSTAATVALPGGIAPKLRPSVENLGIEEYVNVNSRILEAARLNVDIAERLYEYGMDDEEMTIGLAMGEAAKTALHAHKEATNAGTAAVAESELTAAVAKARDTFATYRGIARAAFTGLSDRLNLKLVGEPPDDLQRFINNAHGSYMEASTAPYAEKMSKRGYPPEKLGRFCEELDAVAQTGEDQAEAAAESGQDESAAQRDEAYNAFKEFMKEFKGIATTIFRDEPEQLKKLGL